MASLKNIIVRDAQQWLDILRRHMKNNTAGNDGYAKILYGRITAYASMMMEFDQTTAESIKTEAEHLVYGVPNDQP